MKNINKKMIIIGIVIVIIIISVILIILNNNSNNNEVSNNDGNNNQNYSKTEKTVSKEDQEKISKLKTKKEAERIKTYLGTYLKYIETDKRL